MPAFKRDLSNVQELLSKGKFEEARTECSQALKEGWGSTYDAHVYVEKLHTAFPYLRCSLNHM